MIARAIPVRCNPVVAHLRARLLAAGGTDVIFETETLRTAASLLSRGRFFAGEAVVQIPMEEIIRLDPPGLQLVTGYALHRDGQWWRHSWGLLDAEVVSIGPGYPLYYGADLPDDVTDLFWRRIPGQPAPTDTITSALHVERVRRTLKLGEMCLQKEEVKCNPSKSTLT